MTNEPLAVPPKTGFAMLGIGMTKGYELINNGTLETFRLGRARRITTASIKALMERQLAESRQAA